MRRKSDDDWRQCTLSNYGASGLLGRRVGLLYFNDGKGSSGP